MDKKARKEHWIKFENAQKKNAEKLNPVFIHKMNYVANEASEKCIELSYQSYGHLLKDITLRPKNKLDWSHRRTNSLAGIKGMTLGMICDTTPYDVIEYASINHDPEIGFYKTRNSVKALFVTVAHEMAHYLAHQIRGQIRHDARHPSNSKGRKKIYSDEERKMWLHIKPHGKEWQTIYRLFRITLLSDDFVNLIEKCLDEKLGYM